jgi:two-component system chemotaxis response regulator CheV
MGIQTPEKQTEKPRIIITEFNGILIGFVVHEAKRIRRISWADIEPASFSSGEGTIDKSKITGVTKIENNEVLLILDFESIVQELGLFKPELTKEIELDRFNGIALILDDSITARKIVKESLEELGLTVVEAGDGEIGLQKLEDLYDKFGDKLHKNLKLIISDVEMPRMDGFHFASKVKEDKRFAKVPIVFNSSISDHFSNIRGQEIGGEGYLVKFDANIFFSEIIKILKKHNED